jgi:hypothetical protein
MSLGVLIIRGRSDIATMAFTITAGERIILAQTPFGKVLCGGPWKRRRSGGSYRTAHESAA